MARIARVIRACPLLLLVAACASKSNDPYDSTSGPELVAQVALEGDGIALVGDDLVVPIADGWQDDKRVPSGVRKLLESGRRYVVLKEPIIFAATARPLLAGETPFVPERIELRASHDRRDDDEGKDPPLRPALLIMSGSIQHTDAKERSGIEVVDKLTFADLGNSKGIKALDSEEDRVVLGRGVETALRIVTGRYKQGLAGQSSFDWVATFEDGKPVADDRTWIEALDEPAAKRERYQAIIRRYRPSQKPKETFFSVPLNVVVFCSQMKVSKPNGQPVTWHWEGFWMGRALAVDALPGKQAPAKTTGPRVSVIYKEFRTKPIERVGGKFLSSVFEPITRTGQDAIDEIKRRDAAYVPPNK